MISLISLFSMIAPVMAFVPFYRQQSPSPLMRHHVSDMLAYEVFLTTTINNHRDFGSFLNSTGNSSSSAASHCGD